MSYEPSPHFKIADRAVMAWIKTKTRLDFTPRSLMPRIVEAHEVDIRLLSAHQKTMTDSVSIQRSVKTIEQIYSRIDELKLEIQLSQ